jgi:hypothetical protein
MFPDRLRRRHRAPITAVQLADRRRALRHAFGGALLALALVAVVVLRDVPIAALLTSLTLVTIALVVVDPGKHLLATAAPLPDVHTPPVTGAALIADVSTMRVEAVKPTPPRAADGELLAVASAAGVPARWPAHRVGLHSAAGRDTATTAIPVLPQVQA